MRLEDRVIDQKIVLDQAERALSYAVGFLAGLAVSAGEDDAVKRIEAAIQNIRALRDGR